MQNHKFLAKNKLLQKIAPNLILGVLTISIGALCLSPTGDSVSTKGDQPQIYRSGTEYSAGVSLMFNVYMGTEEVYKILDALKSFNAKATFFIGGCWADDNVDCLRAIYNAGHELGNHGYFHKDHSKLSFAENQKEILTCNRFIELSVGVAPTLFAPPSGAYGNAMLSACEILNMKTILWSKDTIDWRDHDVSKIYSRATKNVKKGDFILMHPTAETAEALDEILVFYNNLGLKPVTVSENLQEHI